MKTSIATVTATVIAASALAVASPPIAHPNPTPTCCDSEFDWAEPYAAAIRNHGLDNLAYDMGIISALAMENACGLVPAIGSVATVEKLSRDHQISPGDAGKLVVAAADVCPDILRMLG